MMSSKEFFARKWDQKRLSLAELRSSGLVTVSFQGSRILVNAPFHEDFRVGARALKARYRHRTSRWSFHHDQREELRHLVETVFGVERVPPALEDEKVSA